MMKADTELRYLKGVGPRRAERFHEAGLATVEDLLYVLPFRYEDRRAFALVRALAPGGPETTLAIRVAGSRLIRTRRPGFTIFEARLEDESGSVRAVWYNQPYLERLFVEGRRAVIFGRASLDRYGREVILENPDYEFLEADDAEGIHTGRIVPVYRKLADLSSRMQRNLIHRALEQLDAPFPGPVPDAIAARHGLLDRVRALREIHFPPPDARLAELAGRATPAQRTLAFEEIFLL
jgi:ATP-dependent DNA helicase RecG